MKTIDSKNAQAKVKDLLVSSLNEIKARNPAFSLRMFARKLGIQAPIVSEVVSGRRLISRKLAEKILAGLKVDDELSNSLLDHFPIKQVRNKKNNIEILNSNSFRLVSDWWYMAILSLSETDHCSSSPNWIASRFNISVSQAEEGIKTLCDLGYVYVDKDALRFSGKNIKFSSSIPDGSIKKHHTQGLELANKALYEIDLELREFGSITFKADPQLINVAKKKLSTVRTEIASLMNTSASTEVYRLQVQLFPLTTRKEG